MLFVSWQERTDRGREAKERSANHSPPVDYDVIVDAGIDSDDADGKRSNRYDVKTDHDSAHNCTSAKVSFHLTAFQEDGP